MARMFRIGNAVYCYYNQAKDLTVFDSDQEGPAYDLLHWLEQQVGPETSNRTTQEMLQIYWDEYLEGRLTIGYEGQR